MADNVTKQTLLSRSDIFLNEPNPLSKEQRLEELSEMISQAAKDKRIQMEKDVSATSELLDLVIKL